MEEKKRVKLSDKSPAPALDRGLAILELLAEAKEGLAFTQLQESLGANATTMTRLLRVLQQRQYIQIPKQVGIRLLPSFLCLPAVQLSTNCCFLRHLV